MVRTHSRGFTLIELVIVIVVIAILSLIAIVLYTYAEQQARDVRNADAADKVGDAIQLFAAKYQHFPKGGNGSTTAIGGNTECADGSNGFVAHGSSTCTVEDTLVASGYLPAGYVKGLSPNMSYPSPPRTDGNNSIMVYIASASSAMVMYSMESPRSSTTAHFNSQLTKCYGSVPPAGSYTPRDSYGMDDGICIQY